MGRVIFYYALVFLPIRDKRTAFRKNDQTKFSQVLRLA
jgi:hypothetical protein